MALAFDPLRLKAVDAEDFQVIAACLQDALMPLGDMTFLPAERRFVAVLDRFMWERQAVERAPQALYQVQAGLRFEGVRAAKVCGIDRRDTKRVLELLTVAGEPGAVTLVFAGGGAIRLEGEGIVCLLEDLHPPRPAAVTPRHPLEGAE